MSITEMNRLFSFDLDTIRLRFSDQGDFDRVRDLLRNHPCVDIGHSDKLITIFERASLDDVLDIIGPILTLKAEVLE